MSCIKASATTNPPCCHLPHQAFLCTWSFNKSLVLYLWNLFWALLSAPLGFNSSTSSKNTTVLLYFNHNEILGSDHLFFHLESLISFLHYLAILPTSFVEFPLWSSCELQQYLSSNKSPSCYICLTKVLSFELSLLASLWFFPLEPIEHSLL